MGLSTNTYTYTGGAQTFNATFADDYLETAHVRAYRPGDVDGLGNQIYLNFVWLNASEIEVLDTLNTGDEVVVERTVPKDMQLVDLNAPGGLTRESISRLVRQALHAVHEVYDGRLDLTASTSLQLPAEDPASPILPGIAARAGRVLGFDSEGDIHLYSTSAPVPYTSRSALVTAVDQGIDLIDGQLLSDGTVLYIARTGSTAIPDLPGMLPFGVVSPNHWAENTTPGTTDMASAIEAAIVYLDMLVDTSALSGNTSGLRVDFLAQDYFISRTVSWSTDFQSVRLYANGARIVASHNGPLFQVGGDELYDQTTTFSSAQPNRDLQVHGFVFKHLDGTANASVALRAGFVRDGAIQNNWFVNFWLALDLYSFANSVIRDNTFKIDFDRTVQAEAMVRFRAIPVTGGGGFDSFGCFFYGNELNGVGPTAPERLRCGIVIHSADGFTYGANHIDFYDEAAIELAMLDDGVNRRVGGILSSGGNYLDGNCSDGAYHVSITGTLTHYGSADPRNGILRNINITGDRMRGGASALSAVRVDVQDGGGWVAANGGIVGLTLANCTLDEHRELTLNLLGSAQSRVPCISPIITGNIFRDGRRLASGASTAVSYIAADSVGWHVTGNVFETERNQSLRSVVLSSSAYASASGTFTNNDLASVDVLDEAVRVDSDSSHTVLSGPNILPSGIWTGPVDALTVDADFVRYNGTLDEPTVRRTSDGLVTLNGAMRGVTTTTGAVPNGTLLMTLPEGLRPTHQLRALVYARVGPTSDRVGCVLIQTNGQVQAEINCWYDYIGLDGITFWSN